VAGHVDGPLSQGASVDQVGAGSPVGSFPSQTTGSQGALIRLSRLGSPEAVARAGVELSQSTLLGAEVRVNGHVLKALLDPGCEAEVVLSSRLASKIGVRCEARGLRVELPDGTLLAATQSDPVDLEVSGLRSSIRAVVVELSAYEVILGKPWFTKFNPTVNWQTHKLSVQNGSDVVVIDASRLIRRLRRSPER